MNQCHYEPVRSKILDTSEQNSSRPLLRQILVSSCIWNIYFMSGLCLGGPTVIIPQLRREANSTETVSPEMATWMSSIHGLAALPWFFLPFLSGRIGRKYPFFFSSIVGLCSFIALYCSDTPKQILIAEIIQSQIFTCAISISIFITSEYSSPKYRGMFLTLKSASLYWGIWVANALGTFFNWKTIAVTGIVCSVYNVLACLFWCESPSWLASRHRYEECARAHKWLKGEDLESIKELDNLIRSCKYYQKEQTEKANRNFLAIFCKTLSDKAFYKSILLCMATLSLYHVTGKLICSVYAIDILKKMTAVESKAYMGMLILDAVTVAGMYVGCFLSKHLKRKTLLFTGSLGGTSFLLMLSFYLYLVQLNIVKENILVSLILLTIYFLFISIGPVIVATSIYGELLPLRYRTIGMFVTGVHCLSLLSFSLKIAPIIFKTLDLHGGFLFFGICSLILAGVLIKYLPETKDKTLEEIEDILVGNVRKEVPSETELIVTNKL